MRIGFKNIITIYYIMIRTYNKVKLEAPITVNAYNLMRYHDNKDALLDYYKETIICENCNSEVSRVHIARHKRTKKCINHLRN
jgi:hypothetical protein